MSNDNTSILFSQVKVGALELPHRIVMAPLTRSRAGEGLAPTEMNATYYAQRASAALIITEATHFSEQGIGYPLTPGVHTPEQIAGWRRITDAVHAKGGRIFLQLWHVGRISHPSLQRGGELPVAPSAIAADGEVFTYTGLQPFVTPRALETAEIPGIVEGFRQGAVNAREAGFDGVEIHGANGYLLNQFLEDSTNKRTDVYGGSPSNRARLLLEVVEAVTGVWGADRVGVRLSPGGIFNTMHDSDPAGTFGYVARELNCFRLAYLHIIEPVGGISVNGTPTSPTTYLRAIFEGKIITAGGYDKEKAERVLATGDADLVAFGKLFIANPDLPERFRTGVELNPPDTSSFYGGDARGYIDYPVLDQQHAQHA
ncbi:MAG: alkene reductase [Pyrinomonadaceae bacterium]|nr:alkene reductase [Pyrinomonadaceae bacterium]